jgi:hypothetical protein
MFTKWEVEAGVLPAARTGSATACNQQLVEKRTRTNETERERGRDKTMLGVWVSLEHWVSECA